MTNKGLYFLLTLRAVVRMVGGKYPFLRMWYCLFAIGVLGLFVAMISDWEQWMNCIGTASANGHTCFWTEERIESLAYFYVRMMLLIICTYVVVELILKPTAEKLTISDELVALGESGVPEAAFALSELYRDCGQEARAVIWNNRSAKLGHPSATERE